MAQAFPNDLSGLQIKRLFPLHSEKEVSRSVLCSVVRYQRARITRVCLNI